MTHGEKMHKQIILVAFLDIANQNPPLDNHYNLFCMFLPRVATYNRNEQDSSSVALGLDGVLAEGSHLHIVTK